MSHLTSAVMGMVMLLTGMSAFGQPSNAISLSNEKPQRGEEVTFTFMPADAAKAYSASLYVFHPSGFNAADVDMEAADNNTYRGSFSLPDSATAVLVSVAETDGDKKWGAAYQVYAAGRQVQGANWALAQIYNGWGESFADIKRDIAKSLAFHREEIQAYPSSARDIGYRYIGLLAASEAKAEAKQFADQLANQVFSSEDAQEQDLISIANAYERFLNDKETADSLRTQIGRAHV